ncbi:STAM-binding protein-like [Tribolium castaneum]|uniref:AMSH-like protease n=1 Tax=Tribolium castaneum TaxID=7070 RepID=D6X4C6_TRICA|nr:PREDICTED: STAM-binding protein-like [Tribolium castaneum]EEZ97535.1 AMSH-like protease [Tribolium castaneum]|eukprot:XP_969757.1 PREDICTED: STAM-binding protein-like [Tribolium castaneum]
MQSNVEPELKHTSGLINPQERLKHLINYSNAVEVDFHIPPTRYYRSGLEMVRMANVYNSEGNYENAYVLYLKFMTLFLEKIRKHPDFNSVPVKMKAINQAKLREVLPKAEKLKERLLEQYKEEFNRYVAERERRKELPKNSADTLATETNFASASTLVDPSSHSFVNVETPRNIDDITYPDPDAAARRPRPVPSAPDFDRAKKPSEIFDSKYVPPGLRLVIVPGQVMVQFQTIAQKNTVNNVETCGILAGKLENNQLIITHMILPKQKGTSDSCTTMNEEEIFDLQDQHNLITIGWIHTHPTQTAFLSSVDLHTHCPYQLLMPEAVAIVCAPRYNETGFFILTPEYGLKFIANCRKSGFHPHPTKPPLFMVAEHVKIDHSADLQVFDLRAQ